MLVVRPTRRPRPVPLWKTASDVVLALSSLTALAVMGWRFVAPLLFGTP